MASSPKVSENNPALWRSLLPLRQAEDHKYARGAAFVWSGPALATGASRLAARAALQIGAGLVTLVGAREALLVHAAHVTSIMLREAASPSEWQRLLAEPRLKAVAIGPAAGIGEATREAVLAALETPAALVLDADALTSFAGEVTVLADAIKARQAPVILTPHEGEARALFGDPGEASRQQRAERMAVQSGAIIVLKGHHSLIAAPDGRMAINRNAPPTLATAGSGDVLAGLVLGLLAQGMPGFEAAAAGVWLHGEAGRLAGSHPIADDFIPAIRHLPAFETL